MNEILNRSLLNCHVRGVHSVMLSESPGKTIRLYVANYNHELWKNEIEPVTLSFHPHHCQLTLAVTVGSIINKTVSIIKDRNISNIEKDIFNLDKWKYHSKINDGEIGFKKCGNDIFYANENKIITAKNSIFMEANEIHTIVCEKGQIAAWLVFEGKEDLAYESFMWTNQNLLSQDYTGFYVKPSEKEILTLLKMAKLL